MFSVILFVLFFLWEILFLIQVALGDMKEVDYGLVVDPSDKFDSVKAFGQEQPDPAQSVYWKGML